MATGRRAFDEGGVERFDAVGVSADSDDCTGTDDPESDLSEEKEATSSSINNSIVLNINAPVIQIGRDNFLSFRSVEDPTSSETPSNVEGDEGGPVLRELWKPSGLLRVGRSRLGFPDCHLDHLVQLLVCKNQHAIEALDISDNYDVTVAVSYDAADGSTLKLPDYQYERIKSETNSGANGSAMAGVVGYLFRFHEPNTKFKITFSLNSSPPKRRGKKKSVQKPTAACETICQISVTLETGSPKSSKSGTRKTTKKAKESTVPQSFALSPASLSRESTMLYKRSSWVVRQFQSSRDNARWEDFDNYASDLLLKFPDADTQIAIKLEQSVEACYQNKQDRAQQLIDEALSFMSEAKNQHLLTGRAYGYRAGIFRRQGSLGQAQYYVHLAGQNIDRCQTSMDTSLIAYERASISMDFIGRTPHRSLKQVNEARRNLEKCIDIYQRMETENNQVSVMKHHFVVVLVKMAMLLLDCRTDAARKRTVAKEFITTARSCLDTMRSKYWSEFARIDKTLFYLASFDLEYRQGNYAEAEEFALLAKDKAVEMGLEMEASHAQERLDFMLTTTRGDTIDSGPQQSESEGENADISSSGSESDLMLLIGSE